MIWRCGNCGMLTVGLQAPEECAICGASRGGFSQVDQLEDIKGTETEENLKKAFAGESEANRKYLLFAQMARQEGNTLAEQVFLKFSYDETWHALSHLLYLLGNRTTKENIAEAIKGETHEAEEMYASFEQKAKEEGLDAIALIFNSLSNAERWHAEKLQELLDSMK